MFFNPYNAYELWVTSFGNGLKVADLTPLRLDLSENQSASVLFAPNPANGFIKTINLMPGSTIRITDLNGRELINILQFGDSEIIDVSFLPAGVYQFHAGNSVQKLIRN